jgi:hypothetical protein
MRPLGEEEDLGFALLRGLGSAERGQANFHPVPPPDFTTGCRPTIGAVERPPLHGDARRDVLITEADADALRYERDRPPGVSFGEMDPDSQGRFRALVDCYLSRVSSARRATEMDRIEQAGIDALHFAWAGAEDYEGGHYYRIQGPVTLIEFNNTEGDANHVHSVWRNPDGDFGRDRLGR